MATRGPSSNPATFSFGKSPKARVGYPGGQMVVVGMVFKLATERFLNSDSLGLKVACGEIFYGMRNRSK